MGNTEQFDVMANRYDTDDRVEVASRCSQAIRDRINSDGDKSAIDFGCGTGLVGLDLLDSFSSVLFLDSSQNMIDVVKGKIEKMNAANATTMFFDLEKEPLENIHADYIFVVQTLLHIKDTKDILTKLFAMLNDSGHLFIIDFDKNSAVVSADVHNGFVEADLLDIIKDVGFSNIKREVFFRGNNIFMNQDASLFIMECEK